ncbi:MAG TPA: hypothetical protein VL225_06445 [Vicinamibacterales bacterium]|jgi:hypothetical protein|nr:hypothetical protein [Vicinamibacterales bacterium]
MTRAIWALAGTVAVLATSQAAPPDVDAVTFALAFRAGQADQYKNKQVSGSGTSFHGAINERVADGSTRTAMVMTLGSADPDGKLTLIRTWDDFVAAERARTTLVVALSGPRLAAPSGGAPVIYDFSGVYDGQVRTIVRVPQASDATVPDSGPCPGERPQDAGQTRASFFCAPLLTGATAAVRR